MDRLLFGDNQFFGINHMSEEKARAQAMRFQDIGAVIDVLDAAYDEGIRTFMCTTHDRIALVCDHVRANPERYRDFALLPGHALRPQVRQRGHRERHARRGQTLPPRRGPLQRRAARRPLAGDQGRRGHDDAADRRRDEDVRRACARRSIFLQNLVVDLLLGLGFKDAFRVFADHVRERYDAEPGFITMNLPMLLDVLDEVGIENPIVCSNINKIGFRMCGGVDAYEAALREREFRAIAMSVFASGAIPAGGGDRVGLRPAEPALDRLRRLQRAQHPQPRGSWSTRALASL